MATNRASFFAQCRPKTGWKTLYTAVGGEIVSYINIANVNGVDGEFYICIAPQGKGYNKSTALVWSEQIQDHDNDVWGYGIPLQPGMRIGVLSSKDNALNFTVYGSFGGLFG